MEPTNPFTPIFGRIPPIMAGRELLLQDIETAFEGEAADPNLCSIFVGARGTGKTALLTYLAREASARGWISVSVSAVDGMLEDIVERAREAASEFIEPEGGPRLTSLSIGQLLGAEWEYADPASGNWRTRMTDLIRKLNEQGVGLLITVDEVKASSAEMVQLASVYQHFVREERKVSLLMAGLPKQVSTLVSDESVSFLRRAKIHRLKRIPDADVAAAMRRTIEESGKSIEEKALAKVTAATEGFPYMMQLTGFRLWNQAKNQRAITPEHVDVAIALAVSDFEESVLAATYLELSKGDVAFLEAMLQDEKASAISDIAHRLGKSPSHARTYKARLLEQGIIAEAGRGYVAFDLPYFREYLERAAE